nr:TetR/AcrR family transcriptional regulator [Mammaliicoccus sp. H-M33]
MNSVTKKENFTVYSSAQKRTVQHITQTSFDLLHETDFDQLTVQKICKEAEFNRSTFYRYFEDKFDLLYHITQYIAELLYNEVKASRYDSLFEATIHYVYNNRELLNHVINTSHHVDVFNELTKISSRLLQEFAPVNDDPICKKVRNSSHPDLVSDFYGSGIIHVIKQWHNNKYDYTIEELLEIVEEGPDSIFE